MFAKIFETHVGQILVKKDRAEEDGYEAEVRFYFKPEGLGVCSKAYSFDTWEKADKAFDKVDKELATIAVKHVIDSIPPGLVKDDA